MSGAAGETFLPPGLLERLGGLDVVARVLVNGALAGPHRAAGRGSGDEFARHRAYEPGDDVRRVDWKLWGRTDRLFVREWEPRSDLSSYLVLDATASMAFGDAHGPSKLRYGVYLAAALAHLMLRSGDAVGLAAWSDGPCLLVPPRSGRGQLHSLLTALQALRGDGAGSAAAALERVGDALPRRGRVILISDFLEADDGEQVLAGVGRLRGRGDEVLCLRVLSATETGDRPAGHGMFFDPEHPAERQAADPSADADYPRRLAGYYARLADGLRARGAEYRALRTDEPVERALRAWLRGRRR